MGTLITNGFGCTDLFVINGFNCNNEFIEKSEISVLNDKLIDSNSNDEDMIWWSTETRRSNQVLKNDIPSDEKPDNDRSVTLTTQGTYEF